MDRIFKHRRSSDKRAVCYWIYLGEQNFPENKNIPRIFPENKQNPSGRITNFFSCLESPQAAGTETQLGLIVFLKGSCYHAE